jgi:hypothetical protein
MEFGKHKVEKSQETNSKSQKKIPNPKNQVPNPNGKSKLKNQNPILNWSFL